MALVMFVPSVVALRFADSDDVDTLSYHGSAGVQGYADSAGDDVRIEVFLESGSEVDRRQVRIGNVYFDECEQTMGYIRCIYDEEGVTFSRPLSTYVRIYSDPQDDYEDHMDELPLELSFDSTNPQLSDVEVRGGSEGAEITFVAEDGGSGIREIRVVTGDNIHEGSVRAQEFLDLQDDGRYPKIVDEFDADSPMEVSLSEGQYEVHLVVYDGMGNYEFDSGNYIDVVSTPPSVSEWSIDACSGRDGFDGVERIGKDGAEVCLYFLLDRQPTQHWDMDVQLRNVDRSADHLDEDRPVSISHNMCSPHDDGYLCKVDEYDDGSDIILKNPSGGGFSYTAIFENADDFGNVQTLERTASVDVVDMNPSITGLYSLHQHNDRSYMSPSRAEIRLDFEDADADIDKSRTSLNASGIGGRSSINPDYCGVDYCLWNVTPHPSSNDLKSGEVVLRHLEDVFGNSAKFARVDERVRLNNIFPRLRFLRLMNIDHDDDEDKLFWETDCEQGAGCEACNPDEGGLAGCNLDDIWKYRTAFFGEDDHMDIEIHVEADIKPHIFVDLGETGAGSDDHFTMSCDEMSQSAMIDFGYATEDDFEDDDDDNPAFMYVCKVEGKPTPTGSSLDLNVEDIGGIYTTYHMPFSSYADGGERDVWSTVEVDPSGISPQMMNRRFMNIHSMPQSAVVEFVPLDNAELVWVHPTCYVRSRNEERTEFRQIVDRAFGEWFGNKYYMSLHFDRGSQIEDEYLDEGKADMVCELDTFGEQGGTAYRQQINATYEIEFYDSPYGTPDEAVTKEIDDIVDRWSWYYDYLFADIARIFDTLKTSCSTFYFAQTSVIGTLGAAADAFSWFPAVAEPLGRAKTASESGFGMMGSIIGPTCSFVQCSFCDRDDDGDFLVGGDNWNLCFEGGPIDTWLGGFGVEDWFNELDFYDLIDPDDDETEWVFFDLDTALDPHSSMVAAGMSLCIPGFFSAMERWQQVECRYINCLQNDVVAGERSIDDCKTARGYEYCSIVWGGIWQFVPLRDLVDAVREGLIDLITDPVGTTMTYGSAMGCAVACPGGGLCMACTVAAGFGDLINTVDSFINFVTSNVGEDQMTLFSSHDACAEIEGMQTHWQRFRDDDDDD